jgi:hypothetical protein
MTRTLIIIFILLSMGLNAQIGWDASLFNKKNPAYRDTVWILSGPKILDNNFKKRKLDLILDARTTVVGTSSGRLAGLRIGMEYRRVHRFGIGLYNLNRGVEVSSLEEFDTRVQSGTMYLSYTSLFYERVLYFNPKWEFSTALHMGSGKVYADLIVDGMPETVPWEKIVKPIEFSSSAYYNITYWLSVGGGLGYRFMRRTPAEVSEIYDGPVVIAKVKVKFMKLIRSAWNRDVRYEY